MEAHKPTPVRTYFFVYIALLGLLGLTIIAAFFNLGVLNPIIMLAIATVKAVLVVLFFMHVRGSSLLTKIFVALGVLWLFILFGLTLADYLTRVLLPSIY